MSDSKFFLLMGGATSWGVGYGEVESKVGIFHKKKKSGGDNRDSVWEIKEGDS